MNITFGQWDASSQNSLKQSFNSLKNYLEEHSTDVLLLPELPFSSWITSLQEVNNDLWKQSVEYHDDWLARLDELNVPHIVGTKPIITAEGSKRNVGWIWTDGEVTEVHQKYYLPDEEGFYEATWYDRGDGIFECITINGMKIGFLICTEMWFLKHARAYAEEGIHLLVIPRSTPGTTTEKWITGGRTAGVISGAFCVSSNHEGLAKDGKTQLGGVGWLADPEGELLGSSASNEKWITVNIDLSIAEAAKITYPRYVQV